MPVKDNFMKYKCQIFSKHDTYESALEAEKQIVATSESEEAESRMGKRKVKNNKYDDYVSFPNPPRLLLSKESHKSVSRHTNKDNENSKLNNSQDINGNKNSDLCKKTSLIKTFIYLIFQIMFLFL
ncbi:uncharacterized protein LOC115245830 isoform X2 [Formica exsecta]|uniref:uncharacterized protein LOC115245830 isoform X2 n=1 Tax=Formica exsecta TaxID=72781 RepID=UPI001141488D|nr:uncharacterized protein LOC115245830 isoform X2 [Formica exsecta]